MKTRMQGWLARVALSLVAIAAWGTGATAQSLSGVYGGEKCPYMLMFRGKDVVYMEIIGIAEVPGQYKVDGDKVPVTAGIWSTVFTRNGDALSTLFEGETVVCTKVSDAISLVAVQGVWTLDYRRIVTQEGTPQVYDTRSLPTCSASVRYPCVVLPYHFVLDTTKQGQYSFGPPSDPTHTARGSAAVVGDSIILAARWRQPMTVPPATYRLQVYSSRMHLTRHNRLGADAARWYGFKDLPPGGSLEVTEECWYQRGLRRSDVAMPIEPAPLPPKPKPIDEALVAAMKSDLRNLVTAEEAFFADSVRYTANVGRLQFRSRGGNTAPQVTLTEDGWSAIVGNPRTPTTPRPPAKLEGAPECQ